MSKVLDERIEAFKKNPERRLLTLSLPVIIGMLVQVFYNITDTAFVGRLGVDAIAALTFSFPIYFVGIAIGNLLGAGAAPLMSRYIGAKKKKDASDIGTLLIVEALLLSLLVLLLGLLFVKPVFTLMGATESVVHLGYLYMLPLILAVPILFIVGAFTSIFQSEGNTKLPAIISICSVVLNLSLDYIFTVHLGWGILGISIATVIAMLFSALMLGFFLFVKKKGNIILFPKKRPLQWNQTVAIMKIGAPSSAAHFLMAFSWFFFNRLFAHFGTENVAAYGLVSRIDSIAFMPLFGLTVGVVTLVGMFYGAKEYALLTRVIKAAVSYSLLFTIPLGVLIWFFPQLFLKILTNDVGVLTLGGELVRVAVFSYPLMAIGFMLGRAMLWLGDGKPSLVITSIRLLVIAVPLAWYLTRILSYGPRSILISQVIAGAIASILAFFWLRWKLCKIEGEICSQKTKK